MMLRAFLYLTARTMHNRVVRQVQRVRNPRYAIAIVIGAAYIWFFLLSRHGMTPGGGPLNALTTDRMRDLITVGVFLLFAAGWVFGRRVDALAFSSAEVHFLFPAPLSRRSLIIFKLLRLQLATLVGTAIWVLLIRRGAGDISPLLRALGLWVFFATVSMHRLGAALLQASVLQHGVAGLRRQRIVTGITVSVMALFAWAAYTAWQTATTSLPPSAPFMEIFGAMVDQPLLHALLEPFRVLSQPAFASTHAEWVSAFPFALLIFAAHSVWVVSANTAFEEAAAEASARLAQRIKEFREKGARGVLRAPSAGMIRRTGLPLSATGNPAIAIVWKNALAFLRSMRGTSFFVMLFTGLMLLVTFSMSTDREEARVAVLATIFMFVGWTVILGPRFIRNDLRADLAQLSLLKTYPLSPSSIVAAEVASATLSLTALQFILVAGIFALSFNGPGITVSTIDRILLFAAAPLCLAAVNSVNLAIQNGATLMFPAWMSVGLNRPTGIEAFGQNILLAFASILLLAVALLPASIGVLITHVALLPGVELRLRLFADLCVALVIIGVELYLVMQLLGHLFQKTDPSSIS